MGKMLNKSNSQVKDILRNPIFLGSKIIAMGGSSLVLDNGDDTVTKITCDEMGYEWLSAPQYGMGRLSIGNPYKLPVIADYGEVGEFTTTKKMSDGITKRLDYTVNAIRVPKCKKLKISELEHSQLVRYRALQEYFNEARTIHYTPDAANYFSRKADHWIKCHPDDDYFEELLLALYYMCGDYHARPDILTGGNILVYNDHLALVDPVFDPLLWANMRGEYNHPFDTPQGNKNAVKKPVQA